MLFNTDVIALMAFASEDVVNQWRSQVIEAERKKDQVLDVTTYTRRAHVDTYTRVPGRDTYIRTASADVYQQVAARDTHSNIAARDTYDRVAARDTYNKTAARDEYQRGVGIDRYTRTAARDTYDRIAHTDTYSRNTGEDRYTRVAHTDTYTRVAHRDTYTRVAHSDRYTRVAHSDRYTRVAHSDSYSRVAHSDRYTRVAHTDRYTKDAHRDSYSKAAHRDSYSKTAHRDSYSKTAHRDRYSRSHYDYSITYSEGSTRLYHRYSGGGPTYAAQYKVYSYSRYSRRRYGRYSRGSYSRAAHRDSYSRTAHRDSYTRSAHRDSYTRSAHRDSYSRTERRDSYARTDARDSYARTDARDSYARTDSRDTYARTDARDTYARTDARDTYSRTDARDTYSRQTAVDRYDKVAARDTYERIAGRDTYERTTNADVYTRTAHTDTYTRTVAVDRYTRVAGRDVYSRVAHSDVYSRGVHGDVYTREPQRDVYSRADNVNTGFDHENYVPSTPEFYNLDGKVISGDLEIRLASYDKNADGFGSQDFASIDIYYDVQIRQVQDVQGNEKVTEWKTLQQGSMTEDFDVDLNGYEDGMYEVRSIAYNLPRTENGVTKTYVSGEKIATFMIIDGNAGQDLTILNAPEFQDYIYGIDTYVNTSDQIKKYVDSIIYSKNENQKGLFLEILLEDQDANSYHKTKAALEVNSKLITDKYDVVYETNNDGTPKSGNKTGVVFIPLADMLDDGAYERVKIHLETEEFSDQEFSNKRGDTTTQYGLNQAKDMVYIDVDGENPSAIISDPSSKKVLTENVAIAYSDVGLGLRKKEYQINNGDWIEATNTAQTITLTEPGEYTIRARTTDKAGNTVVSGTKKFTVSCAEQDLSVPKTVYRGESFYAIGDIETNMDITDVKFWIQDSIDKKTGTLVSKKDAEIEGRTDSKYSALIETPTDIPLGTHVVYMTVIYEDGIERTISKTVNIVEVTEAVITPQESDKDENPIPPYLIKDEHGEDTLIIQKGDKFTPEYYQKTINSKGFDISDSTKAESKVPVDSTGHANTPGKYDVIYTNDTETKHVTFTLHVIVNDPPVINAGTVYVFSGELKKEDLIEKITVTDTEDGIIDLTKDDLTIVPKGEGEYEVTVVAVDSMKGRSTKKILLKTVDFSETKDGPRYIDKDTYGNLSIQSIWTEEEYQKALEKSLNNTTPIYEENIDGNK